MWNVSHEYSEKKTDLVIMEPHYIIRCTLVADLSESKRLSCWLFIYTHGGLISRGQFWPSGIVVNCVCPSVSPSVTKFVRAITRYPFKLASPNLDQICKRPWLRYLLFCGTIDCDLQGQIELQNQNLPHFELVHAITHHQLKLQFLNLE